MEFEDDEGGDEIDVAETIQASKRRPNKSSRFKVFNFPRNTIVLMADNRKFLCRVDHEEDLQPLEASKTMADASCHFTVHNQLDGTVVLQADNGKYVSRVRYGDIDLIEALKDEIYESCKFHFRYL